MQSLPVIQFIVLYTRYLQQCNTSIIRHAFMKCVIAILLDISLHNDHDKNDCKFLYYDAKKYYYVNPIQKWTERKESLWSTERKKKNHDHCGLMMMLISTSILKRSHNRIFEMSKTNFCCKKPSDSAWFLLWILWPHQLSNDFERNLVYSHYTLMYRYLTKKPAAKQQWVI